MKNSEKDSNLEKLIVRKKIEKNTRIPKNSETQKAFPKQAKIRDFSGVFGTSSNPEKLEVYPSYC